MFKFTIRELLLLTLVVAMAVAWWIDHRYQQTIIEARDAEVTRLNEEPVRQIGRIGNVIIESDRGFPGGTFSGGKAGGFGTAK